MVRDVKTKLVDCFHRLFAFLRTLLSFFVGDPAHASLPESVRAFVKRQRRLIGKLALEVLPQGFGYRESQSFEVRGVATTLQAEVTASYQVKRLADAELRRPEAARAYLTKLREDLAFQARFSLNQADAAIKALIELVLRPSEMRWLGSEEQIRKEFLDLPANVQASQAVSQARRLFKEAVARIAAARNAVLEAKLGEFSSATLNGKLLRCVYRESLPLFETTLELEIAVDKILDHREADRLVDLAEGELSAAVDAILAASHKALLNRVKEQLRKLAREIKQLPHIELLSDAQIAEAVAPYYGGLNRNLKKHRAKNALVAVEERAREAKYEDDVVKFNEKRAAFADVSSYYPLARSLGRQLVLYVGPTNSGKTWRALNELAEAGAGAYLAPLRLLALEGQEELEKRGKITSFLTGEERDIRPNASFISSTIEMLDLETQTEAIVVDEVQLLADERRGWAWLAAVVGAPARKVIMTGSPDCVNVVKDLAAYLGEELVVHECQRHNELRVAPAPMRLREVRPGMAVVCFSRRDVLRIKTMIQENSDHKVAVVYGNLSPQVRREEARRFRSGEADILVATDAIAMGLNLPISEVLFYTTEKFNGEAVCELTPSEIRQIGGRAGRFGFAQYGVVNALSSESLELIREAIQGESEMLPSTYYVAPGHNHIHIISEVLDTTSLERILTFFDRAIEFSDERFLRSNIDDLSFLSTYVDQELPFLDVTQRLTIACAPVAIRNEKVLHWFLRRMLPLFGQTDEAEEDRDDLQDLFEASQYFEQGTAKNQFELRDAEDYLKTLTVYAWLAYRYSQVFTQIDACEQSREMVNAFIERSLRKDPEKKKDGDDAERSERGPARRRRRKRR